ncbi:Protein FAR1-RELATED SEQUENCE 5 [Linum perenne]
MAATNDNMTDVLDQDEAEVNILDDLMKEYAELCELTDAQVEGLEFKTYEEGRDWYTEYGKARGFDVKLDDMIYDKDGAILECIIAKSVGVGPTDAYRMEVGKYGGHAHVGYTKLDAFNQYSRQEAERIAEDGDRAMSSAIKLVFPEATHRLCSWHLNNNVTQHVKNHKFINEWTRFVKADYPSSEVWLVDWNVFLEDCTLSDNTWINTNLTLKREDWVDTYFKKKFFAGMRTTSRCEGLNSQFGKKVKNGANLKLLDFFISFDRWMSELREEELRLDYQSIHSTPEIQSKALKSLEESAAVVYSLKAFLKFGDELECSTGCIKEGNEIDGGCHTYTLSMFGAEDISWKVTYDDTTNTAHYSCDKFIQMGIPCPHMLFVLKEESSCIFQVAL